MDDQLREKLASAIRATRIGGDGGPKTDRELADVAIRVFREAGVSAAPAPPDDQLTADELRQTVNIALKWLTEQANITVSATSDTTIGLDRDEEALQNRLWKWKERAGASAATPAPHYPEAVVVEDELTGKPIVKVIERAAPAPVRMTEYGSTSPADAEADLAEQRAAGSAAPEGREVVFENSVAKVTRAKAAPAPPEQAIADTSPPPGKRFMTSSTEVLGDALPDGRGFTDEDVERFCIATYEQDGDVWATARDKDREEWRETMQAGFAVLAAVRPNAEGPGLEAEALALPMHPEGEAGKPSAEAEPARDGTAVGPKEER